MHRYLYILLLFPALTACFRNDDNWAGNDIDFDGTGYRPVYLEEEKAAEITSKPGEALVDPGKIYLLEPYIFVNERGRGIHIIDNRDPAKPENISFISIPGNHDMAAKGTWLYADNNADLLTFDISNPREVRLVRRTAGAIPVHNYPPHTNVYFECADPEKGVVVAWEKVSMTKRPKCRR